MHGVLLFLLSAPPVLPGAEPAVPAHGRLSEHLLAETRLAGLHGGRLPHPVLLLSLRRPRHPDGGPAHRGRPVAPRRPTRRTEPPCGLCGRHGVDDAALQPLPGRELPPVAGHSPHGRTDRLSVHLMAAEAEQGVAARHAPAHRPDYLLALRLWRVGLSAARRPRCGAAPPQGPSLPGARPAAHTPDYDGWPPLLLPYPRPCPHLPRTGKAQDTRLDSGERLRCER